MRRHHDFPSDEHGHEVINSLYFGGFQRHGGGHFDPLTALLLIQQFGVFPAGIGNGAHQTPGHQQVDHVPHHRVHAAKHRLDSA